MTALARPTAAVGRAQLWLVGLLVVLAAVAWWVVDARMEGMDAGPGSALGSLGFYVVGWVVMMAAMMFPSVWPMVAVYARVEARTAPRDGAGRLGAGTALFVAGYLAAWTAFGLVAYGLVEGVRALSIDALSWERGGRYLAGGVLLGAAAYQLTPLKHACLRRCRGPLAFLLESWRGDRRRRPLGLGLRHGAWCVGCCWALMAALFALGVMSVGWMLVVGALIAAEKLLPWMAVASRGATLVLLALGVAAILAPEHVPGLTIPGESAMPMDEPGMPME